MKCIVQVYTDISAVGPEVNVHLVLKCHWHSIKPEQENPLEMLKVVCGQQRGPVGPASNPW